MGQSVLLEVSDGVALVTLNRPEKRNALNADLLANLYDCVDRISSDGDVRAAVITGAGTAFCAGLDLKAIATDNLIDPRGDGKDLIDLLGTCEKPVVGAVNGPAFTGGFEIALNCDFLIASEQASFADTHVKMGIHPGWGMSQLLQQAVGRRMAKQMSLTCQPISAVEALRVGLVNEIVPAERLVPRAMEVAGQIAKQDQDMVRTFKRLIERSDADTQSGSLAHERRGFAAFIEKNWKRSR